MKHYLSYETHPLRAWIISLLGGLFFFYGFLQTNIMGSFSDFIIKEFHIDATKIAFATSSMFYANIIFLIPAGLIIDRISVRKVLLINMLIAILGTLIFAFASNITFVALGRFITGIMNSFALIASLKIASYLFPPKRIALANSLIITIGMLGGFFADLPVEAMINAFGWRQALIGMVFIAILIMIIFWFAVRIEKEEKPAFEMIKEKRQNIWKSLKSVMSFSQNWYAGIFITALNLPLAVLGALFGISFLKDAHSFSAIQAASITSMLFLGFIFGSPFFGWLSDYLCRRKLPMFLGAFFCLILTLILLFSPKLDILSCQILHFLIGFACAAQVLGYPIIVQNNSEELVGTALSLASLLIMGAGYGLSLPFVGWLLDIEAKHVGAGLSYTIGDYQKALITIPLGILISIIILFFIKEAKHKKI